LDLFPRQISAPCHAWSRNFFPHDRAILPRIPLYNRFADVAMQKNVEGYEYWFHTVRIPARFTRIDPVDLEEGRPPAFFVGVAEE
jgi:hypothetical protein